MELTHELCKSQEKKSIQITVYLAYLALQHIYYSLLLLLNLP
jgi:hypothetical protein